MRLNVLLKLGGPDKLHGALSAGEALLLIVRAHVNREFVHELELLPTKTADQWLVFFACITAGYRMFGFYKHNRKKI